MKQNLDGRVDDYIAKSAPFAQPILGDLRALVHRACPAATETIKWGFPHFEHAGRILCSMAAFKAHCSFGFWHHRMEKQLAAQGFGAATGMGSFGRIARWSDLPSRAALERLIRTAAKLNISDPTNRRVSSRTGTKPKPLRVPADLAAGLKQSARARNTFENFSPSHRKEYIQWITEAKRVETRQKRLVTTLQWLAQGKVRNWKYVAR